MRILGKTNIELFEIGLGGIPIQRTTQEQTTAIIDEMVQRGMNFIDTARAYTISEDYIGKALQGRRDQFVLATKSMGKTYQDVANDVDLSLMTLQTSVIDLYQLHNVKPEDDYTGPLKALQAAKQAHKIKHIGITSHSYEVLMDALDRDVFETIQFPYNFLETKAETLFEKAKAKHVGVIVMKPLGGGAIDNGSIALKFILNNPNVSVVIPGMGDVSEVIANSLVTPGIFSASETAYIDKTRKELEFDFCRRCGYCMPCTVGINIPMCFVFESYDLRYNLKAWANERYATLSVKADACIECGICESRCPYHLPIIQKLKRVKETFNHEF